MDVGSVKYSFSCHTSECGDPQRFKKNGLTWTISRSFDYPATVKSERKCYLRWEFEWDDTEGIDGYEGHIHCENNVTFGEASVRISKVIYVKITKAQKVVELMVDFLPSDYYSRLDCSIHLEPIRKTDEMGELEKHFEPSEATDTVLVVEGKKMHVNKGILSFHSTYFRTLFNSEFKEKTMDEIPIEDVKYSEFARLLSVISPDPIFATEESCESLLELADRFMMPSVTRHVEYFLLTNLKLHFSALDMKPERILELADRFKLPNVTRHVEQCLLKSTELRFCHVLALAEKYKFDQLKEEMIGWICSKEHMKAIKQSSEYLEFSDSLKAQLFEKLINL